jgi:hypothetical protein
VGVLESGKRRRECRLAGLAAKTLDRRCRNHRPDFAGRNLRFDVEKHHFQWHA